MVKALLEDEKEDLMLLGCKLSGNVAVLDTQFEAQDYNRQSSGGAIAFKRGRRLTLRSCQMVGNMAAIGWASLIIEA